MVDEGRAGSVEWLPAEGGLSERLEEKIVSAPRQQVVYLK